MDKLTPEQLKQLEQLKDIHLPEPISWWPLAVGWWMVLALLLMVIIGVILWSKRATRLVKRDALTQLAELDSDNPTELATQLSALLKRVGIYRALSHRGQRLDALTGQGWANYLQDNGFSREQTDFLTQAPYSNQFTTPDIDALKRVSAKWISQQFTRGATS